jgi:hypothetical protein
MITIDINWVSDDHHHQCQTMAMKRARAMAARGMAAVTRVVGNKEGDGEGAREGGMIW